ncbi:hypothetical protein ACIOGT_17075 [Streptomyces microflavus]|uniref:hypothetical protein n=1 Tax=Streptomyces microflavus TaxID=1919 RepID=UPI0037FD3A05
MDLDALHQVVEDNATRIVRIHEHGHATNLEPFFLLVRGEPAALQDYSSATATYWPRRGSATDISDQATLDALQKLGLQGGDRMFESFAADIEKDLRGFAKPGSVQTLVDPPEPIAARWELRTSEGSVRRVDRFELDVDHARIWRSDAGPRPYKAFLAEICKWDLLKERLLEGLDEQVELEKKPPRGLGPAGLYPEAAAAAPVRSRASPVRSRSASRIHRWLSWRPGNLRRPRQGDASDARLPRPADRCHQSLGGPIVSIRDNRNVPRAAGLREFADPRTGRSSTACDPTHPISAPPKGSGPSRDAARSPTSPSARPNTSSEAGYDTSGTAATS